MSNRKGRFNANITPSNHAGCHIAAQSKRDKAKHLERSKSGDRPSITYISNAKGIFGSGAESGDERSKRNAFPCGRGNGYSRRVGS